MNGSRNELSSSLPAVLPSMLQCDFGHLAAEVAKLEQAGARGLHLDVMDGRFVPNFTYGMPIVEAIRKMTDLPLDVHLMIEEPERYVPAFADAGADIITVHIEAVKDPLAVLEQIRSTDVGAGLAINPATPLERVLPYVAKCDLVLVMSVPAGFGGQAFHPEAIERVRKLKQLRPDLLVEVDGGINEQTIGSCRRAGADLFVVGSAIFRSDDYGAALERLNAAL